MKMILGKQTNRSQTAKDAGVFGLPRPRGRKRGTRDFFRALSETTWPAPHAPVLRRLHD
ncbi:MAG TPA: hypothetical protein VN873_12880 [Candidatus Angelobacter sp.]|nr:hypothetical protein [Candidatus Angelobacter sp.]